MRKEIKCEYDISGVCHSPDGKCGKDIVCGAKMDAGDNGMILRPKITVMQPTVVNVDGPSDQSVSSQEIVCGHLSIDYPGRCTSHTSEFCKKRCAFNHAWQEVVDDILLPDLGERPLDSFGDFDNREDGK